MNAHQSPSRITISLTPRRPQCRAGLSLLYSTVLLTPRRRRQRGLNPYSWHIRSADSSNAIKLRTTL